MLKTKSDIIRGINLPDNIIKAAIETYFDKNKNGYNLEEFKDFKKYINIIKKSKSLMTPFFCINCGRKNLYEPTCCIDCGKKEFCKYF